MTVKEAYEKIGADYDDVLKRLMKPDFVERFAGKFLDDGSFEQLRQGLEDADPKTAFLGAHTLKGVCQNLGLSNLFEPANELCESLRGGEIPENADQMFEIVKAEYEKTVEALREAL